jgi:2-iminobutanoate/2-iminopropanoate deaminase
VKVTTYLSDRCFGAENGRLRQEILGDRTPAVTVIIAGIFDAAWLLEIEAIAVS